MSPTKAKPKEKPKKRSQRPIKGGRKDGVQLIPQPHGGALLPGGQKGQTPGPGRPPNALRESMRGDLDKLLPGLWSKYETGKIDALDFANFLAKYGLGTKDELDVSSHPEFAKQAERAMGFVQSAQKRVLSQRFPESFVTVITDEIWKLYAAYTSGLLKTDEELAALEALTGGRRDA